MKIKIPHNTEIGFIGDSSLMERTGFPTSRYKKEGIDIANLGWPVDSMLPDPVIPGISADKIQFARKVWLMGLDEGMPMISIKTDEWIAIMNFLIQEGNKTIALYQKIGNVRADVEDIYT